MIDTVTEAEDTKEILKSILEELKGIRNQLSRQHDWNGPTSKDKPIQSASSPDSKLTPKNTLLEASSLPSFSHTFPQEKRNGPILHEALRRYRTNAVPSWSTLYGANLIREEIQEDRSIIARDSEWTSIMGNFWKIPNDNRVNFCFLDPGSNPKRLVQVRNFLFYFHKPHSRGLPKCDNFNVWDWFDTGISAYWYPGKSSSSIPEQASSVPTVPKGSIDPSNAIQISSSIAPWRRIINLQGLTTLENVEGLINREEITDSDLCPFLITDTEESIFQRPIDEMIAQALKYHLRCIRVPITYHDELKTKDCALFHITFYEILPYNPSSKTIEMWPCGDLYSDGQQHAKGTRKMRESALTIIAIPSRELRESKARSIFWTMICLRPSQFPHLYYSEQGEELSPGRTNEMVDDMSDFIHKSLITVISRWEEIAFFFDRLLTEKANLLDPDYHDSLLTDDDKFSRSKKYFWAIEFLKEAGNSISDNIRQIQHFLAFLKSNPPASKKAEIEFQMRLKKHHLTLQKLESLQTRFWFKKEEAMALRDGLFSASAVMDSRASNQLGQNVKLLTFVSIFFLPISFCASLWSINDSLFSLTAFAIFTPVIGISTYIIVFNLASLATFFATLKAPRLSWSSHSQRPSRWSLSHSYPIQLLSKTWSNIAGANKLIPRRRRSEEDYEGEFRSTPLGDLRDVFVKVEVEVQSHSKV